MTAAFLVALCKRPRVKPIGSGNPASVKNINSIPQGPMTLRSLLTSGSSWVANMSRRSLRDFSKLSATRSIYAVANAQRILVHDDQSSLKLFDFSRGLRNVVGSAS